MICKGTTHDSGGRLARYLITGKEGERAEMWELRGFASPDIVDAFRSVHVIAEGTKCQEPFFHVQVRCPEGESLTCEQWVYTANRIERMLGLTNQPRAIAFHIEERSGERHIHVAWSRIDEETLTAKPLPFWKERLKKVSRELELHLGLTLVPNERESSIKYAPTRAEEEQARRLGLDIHEIRQTIRDCYEKSDCGQSFEAALAENNLLLAKGDWRDFVVIDHAGGMHAIGKRILDVSAKEIRARLGDLDRESLLTVEQAQERVDSRAGGREKQEPVWDRDVQERKWQEALALAAIEKEKIERQFVEPERAGGRSPFEPPPLPGPTHPQLNRASPEFWFEDIANEVTQDGRSHQPPENLRGAAADIWKGYRYSPDPAAFARDLGEHGILLAAVTKEEADRSYREASFAKAIGRFAPIHREGEIVAIDQNERVYKLTRRTTGDKVADVEKFLAKLDRTELHGIETTKQIVRGGAELGELERQAFRDLSRVGLLKREKEPRLGRPNRGKDAQVPPLKGAGKAVETVASVAAEALELFGNMFGATAMTPERVQAAIDAHEKATRQSEIDFERFRSDADYRRQVEDRAMQKLDEERQRSYYEQGLDDRQR